MGEIYRSGYTGVEIDTALANSISHVATTSGNPHGTTASDVGAVATDDGALIHKGGWDASTNSPTLANGTGTKGDLYHVSVAGSQDFGAGSISFNLGEIVSYDGTVWSKLGIDAYTKTEADSLLSNKQSAKPDGTNLLIQDNKVAGQYLPDYLLGQVMYGGNLAGSVATLTLNAKTKLGITDATITLTNDDTAITGYVANNGIYYIATEDSSFASLEIKTGDWLISTGVSWTKVDNSDCVSGVKGDNETVYRTGNINITKDNIGLGNVDNTSDADKPVSNATQTALGNKVDKVNGKGLSTNDYTTDEKDKLEGIAAGAQINTITGIKGNSESDYRTGNVNITKDNIGLGNVDNTSDANKPVSEAMLTALNGKSNTDHTHNYAGSSTPGGVATSSTKLETARSIFGQSFNGTTNIDYPEVDGNLDTAGWYRVFTKGHTTSYGASLVFAINTTYNNNPASSAIIIVNDSSSSPAITTICSSYTSVIPKVRAVWRNGYVCYIDIYYNVSVSNKVKITQLASAGLYSYDWTISSTLSIVPEIPSGYTAKEQSFHSNAITSTNFNAENFNGTLNGGVTATAATSNLYRHVWFSNDASTYEERRANSDNFMFNPVDTTAYGTQQATIKLAKSADVYTLYSSGGTRFLVSDAVSYSRGMSFAPAATPDTPVGMIGAFSKAAADGGFQYYFMGSTFSDPAFKVDNDGNATFKGKVESKPFIMAKSIGNTTNPGAKWYRIAECENFYVFNNLILQLGRSFTNTAPETYTISITHACDLIKFATINCACFGQRCFTKIRIVKATANNGNGSAAYIDVYYSETVQNECFSQICDNLYRSTQVTTGFKPVNFTVAPDVDTATQTAVEYVLPTQGLEERLAALEAAST